MKLLVITDENISFREAVDNLENERFDGFFVCSFPDSADLSGSLLAAGTTGLQNFSGGGIIFVRRGDDVTPVRISEIAGISTGGEVVIIHLRDGREILGDMSLKEYAGILDHRVFIRISRQWIINVTAIQKLSCGTLGSGHVYLDPDIDIVLSREKYSQIVRLLSGRA